MAPRPDPDDPFRDLRAVRDQALEHARMARRLAAERKVLIEGLLERGYSQADIARGLGVTRQAIQKMRSL